MNNTFVEGDKVVVNKLLFGARIPITPLSIHFGTIKKYLNWIEIPYFRLWGYREIKRNDILVFNLPSEIGLPIDEKKEMVKRCVALPGDFIEIKNGDVFINQKVEADSLFLKWYYINGFKTNSSECFNKMKSTVKEQLQQVTTSGEGYFSSKEIQHLYSCDNLLQFQKKYIQKNYYSPTMFPNNSLIKYNLDFFGPLYIPKKEQIIPLNHQTIILYKSIIETFEGNSISTKENSIFINGVLASTYTFKQNYFFVLGDNRYNSIDSRYWGFLPESHIIGIGNSL